MVKRNKKYRLWSITCQNRISTRKKHKSSGNSILDEGHGIYTSVLQSGTNSKIKIRFLTILILSKGNNKEKKNKRNKRDTFQMLVSKQF